jgi:hypothetical protein
MAAGLAGATRPAASVSAPSAPSPSPAPRVAVAVPRIPPAAPAPAGLPVIDYWTSPRGFPPDPAPASTVALGDGLRPDKPLPVYDRPGGRPRAVLPRSISGLPVTVPIVVREPGWVAVLLPSANRRIGWLPERGWTRRPLPDSLLLHRRTHILTWLRDGRKRAGWTVSVGTPRTPTPPGRTFVLGRTPTSGHVYGGLDALALASVPDRRESLPPALRRAHTGIHGWYREDFGRGNSNGCIRMPRDAQRTLLREIPPGTPVIVTG